MSTQVELDEIVVSVLESAALIHDAGRAAARTDRTTAMGEALSAARELGRGDPVEGNDRDDD